MLDSYAIYTRIDYCIKVDFLFSFVVLPLPFPAFLISSSSSPTVRSRGY